MNKVLVLADQDGCVVNVYENNPEYGYVRVEQTTFSINHKGWLKNSKRTAFIKGKVDDLVAADFQRDQELPGKIIVMESLFPFNLENPEKDLKIAGDTGIVCRIDDQPIYRQTFYTTNMNAQDELIMHTNTDEIKEVQASIRALNSLKAREQKEVTL